VRLQGWLARVAFGLGACGFILVVMLAYYPLLVDLQVHLSGGGAKIDLLIYIYRHTHTHTECLLFGAKQVSTYVVFLQIIRKFKTLYTTRIWYIRNLLVTPLRKGCYILNM
jgi:hypothetical protein